MKDEKNKVEEYNTGILEQFNDSELLGKLFELARRYPNNMELGKNVRTLLLTQNLA